MQLANAASGWGSNSVTVASYVVSPGPGWPALQFSDCRAAAERHGWTVGREFTDYTPPGFERLDLGEQWRMTLRMAESGLLDGIVLHDLTTVTSDTQDYLTLVNWAADHCTFALVVNGGEYGRDHLIGRRPVTTTAVA
ncbi:recombinase family protein (plasmid) [Kitasatospora sp. NBC_01246]|uniref:recombinase family protein n=1 Tax=Kitasatospora sp. NBC_01246 TaxID=2903570 RepID=UPI002E305536|nr:recombinase family protein [Kitasatospora sp. NBC_01246]